MAASEETHGEKDFIDREGAVELKTRIETYWRERGFEIAVDLVQQGFTPALRRARFDIRSDLINGMPRPLPTS